jgi:PBP1b-binding outer membrane lipoprotein LpoB
MKHYIIVLFILFLYGCQKSNINITKNKNVNIENTNVKINISNEVKRPPKYIYETYVNEPYLKLLHETRSHIISVNGAHKEFKVTIDEIIVSEESVLFIYVLDKTKYKTSRKVTDSEYNSIKIKEHKFHGEWNYTISPQLT